MPLPATSLPYGIRDIKLYVFTGETPATTGVDLPNARTLSFSEAEDFEELRGDDGVVAVHGNGPSVDFDLESGGINFQALKALNGGTVTTTGVSPNAKDTYTKKDTDIRPYCKIEGQSISDSGGDFHVILHKARSTGEVSGELADGSFWLTSCSGRAIARTSDREIYSFTHNEQAVAIT
jgi:hypothetical protein